MEQHQRDGERGAPAPRADAPDARAFGRTIECADSARTETTRAAAVARGRGVRRGAEEDDRHARPRHARSA